MANYTCVDIPEPHTYQSVIPPIEWNVLWASDTAESDYRDYLEEMKDFVMQSMGIPAEALKGK